MREVVRVLQTGIILATPVFFLATLVVLWRIVRTTHNTMAVVVHVKRQLDVLGRGGLAGGVRSTPQVQEAEGRFHPPEAAEEAEADEDHRG
ncbi:MAG: hypothetical protein ACLF0G_11325 [Candidatus Brocadiia bacterium]